MPNVPAIIGALQSALTEHHMSALRNPSGRNAAYQFGLMCGFSQGLQKAIDVATKIIEQEAERAEPKRG